VWSKVRLRSFEWTVSSNEFPQDSMIIAILGKMSDSRLETQSVGDSRLTLILSAITDQSYSVDLCPITSGSLVYGNAHGCNLRRYVGNVECENARAVDAD